MGYLHYFTMLHARPALLGGSVNIVKMLVVEVSWQSNSRLDSSSGYAFFWGQVVRWQFDSKKKKGQKKIMQKKVHLYLWRILQEYSTYALYINK